MTEHDCRYMPAERGWCALYCSVDYWRLKDEPTLKPWRYRQYPIVAWRLTNTEQRDYGNFAGDAVVVAGEPTVMWLAKVCFHQERSQEDTMTSLMGFYHPEHAPEPEGLRRS